MTIQADRSGVGPVIVVCGTERAKGLPAFLALPNTLGACRPLAKGASGSLGCFWLRCVGLSGRFTRKVGEQRVGRHDISRIFLKSLGGIDRFTDKTD